MDFALVAALAQATVESPWTPTMIGALFAGLVTVIGAIGGVLVQLRSGRKEGQAAGAVREAKLDNITVIVNGRYSEVLNELATLKETIAELTGAKADRTAALAARKAVEDHRMRTDDAFLATAAEAVAKHQAASGVFPKPELL